MTDHIGFDFTERPAVAHLIEPMRELQRVTDTANVDYLIVGAVARDLILHVGHGQPIMRATRDIDIAIAVQDWAEHDRLRAAFEHKAGDPEHRVQVAGTSVDIVPFGGVERPDRTIAWPPRGDVTMSTLGMAEAMTSAEPVRLAPDLICAVASLPAQAIMKVTAWHERGVIQPGRDSHDLHAILRSYAAAWNSDRLYTAGMPFLEAHDFDAELGGAMLLGHDARRLLADDDERTFISLVRTSLADTGGLPDAMPGDRASNATLLRAFLAGLDCGSPTG